MGMSAGPMMGPRRDEGDKMSAGSTERFVLRLEGSRARDGILLQGLKDFAEDFLRALRWHDRASRGETIAKSGHPARRDELLTAFRIVGYEIGSAILTIEPAIDNLGDESLDVAAATLPASNMASLLACAQGREPLDPDVARALDDARRHLGNDGRFHVGPVDGADRAPFVTFDAKTIPAMATPQQPVNTGPVTVSGRLHAIDIEPDRVQIRAADGADWRCTYPEEEEARVKALLGGIVVARGIGRRTDGRRGEIAIETIKAIPYAEETPLFTRERVPIERLMVDQHIEGPQGLASLVDPGWDDDDPASQAFLAAVLDQ